MDARADPQVWINPGIYSLHFDRGKDLRDDNIGVGIELVMAPEHAVSAGTFINSNRARSRYVAYAWRPLRWELGGVDVALGVVAGAFDGYPNYRDGGWFVAPLPLLAVEGRRLGVNLSIIPTIRDRLDGAIAIQLKLRVW
jgi:hypothetical protein